MRGSHSAVRRRVAAGSTTIPIYALPPASGTSYFVDAVNGNDANNGLAAGAGHAWATLQKAVDNVTAGSIVSVYNGDYTSAGVVFNCANKNGTPTNWIIFKNAAGQSPRIVGQTTTQFPFQIGNCSYIALQGFEFAGTNASLTLSAALANPSQIQYLTQATTIGSGTVGGTHHIQLLNCYIHDWPAAGVGCYNSDYLTVKGCRVDNNALYDSVSDSGIDITSPGNSDTVAGYHFVIVGNTCTGNECLVPTSPGGQITDGEGLIIDSGAINSYTGKILIANNIMNGNGSIGIEVFDSANSDVIFNTCYGNNIILTSGGGICFPTSTNCNGFNNIVQSTVSTSTLGIGTDGAGSVYGYNIGYGGNGAALPGSNNKTTNPLFVNPAAANFALQAGSPAIGAATGSWTIATDIFGNVRPGPNGTAMGAVEYYGVVGGSVVAINATATASSGAAGVTSITSTNLTVAAGATSMLVWLCFGNYSSAVSPTGLTVQWDNAGTPQTMTSLGSAIISGGAFFQAYLFGLVSPHVGNLTLNASWTTACSVAMDAVAFNNTLTSSVASCFVNFNTNTGSSTTATVTGTSAAGNMNCAGMASNFPVTSLTATGSTAVLLDENNIGTGGSTAPGASSVAWTGAMSSSGAWAICCIDVVA